MNRVIGLPLTEWQDLGSTDLERAAQLLQRTDGDQPWAGKVWTWQGVVVANQRAEVTYTAPD